MSWWVYMLRCCDGTLYTGASADVAQRLAAHNAGRGAKYTRSRRPCVLVYREEAADRSAALRREAAIKRLSRQEKLALVRAWADGGQQDTAAPLAGDKPARAAGGSKKTARNGRGIKQKEKRS